MDSRAAKVPLLFRGTSNQAMGIFISFKNTSDRSLRVISSPTMLKNPSWRVVRRKEAIPSIKNNKA